MKSLDLHEKLIGYLAFWKANVTSSNSFGLTNKNIGSETLYMNMLNLVHGHSLIEASKESVTFPAVDLFDRARGIAIQVTFDNRLSNIKKRIDIFNEKGMGQDFGEFSFYIIGERSKAIKPGQIYGGIPLDTNVIDTKMFIQEVRTENKLQEVCEYLEFEIIPKVVETKETHDVTSQVFSGAVIHPGATVNVTTGSQTVNVSPQSLSLGSANQPFVLHKPNENGVAEIACLEIDEDRQELDYVISKLLEGGLRAIESYEIDSIYKVLDNLEDTQYADLAGVLWLLLYFENSALNSPALQLKKRGALKKGALSNSLIGEHYRLLAKFELFQATSKKLMDYIECIEKAHDG